MLQFVLQKEFFYTCEWKTHFLSRFTETSEKDSRNDGKCNKARNQIAFHKSHCWEINLFYDWFKEIEKERNL